MEIKFTPWRMAYIKSSDSDDVAGDACVLCELHQADPADDPDNLVLYRGHTCYVLMNRYPYNTGHLMVVPYEHTADLPGMDAASAHELFTLTRQATTLLGQAYQPHGFNIGMNLGRTAGAGIDAHIHMHIVPRWSGDTNYMPIIGGTKLVPEALEQTYQRLQPLFTTLPAQ